MGGRRRGRCRAARAAGGGDAHHDEGGFIEASAEPWPKDSLASLKRVVA